MRGPVFIILLGVALGAYAKTRLLEHVPLQWRPTSELRLGAMEMSQMWMRPFEAPHEERLASRRR